MKFAKLSFLGFLSSAVALIVLGGCASYTPVLTQQYQPKAEKAYIFGRLTWDGLANMGLVIQDVNSPKNYMIKFTKEGKVSLIEVEPGEYKITKFVAASAFNEKLGEKKLESKPFDTKFKVDPNTASYIGDISGVYTISVWRITSVKDQFDQSAADLLRDYPAMTTVKTQRISALE